MKITIVVFIWMILSGGTQAAAQVQNLSVPSIARLGQEITVNFQMQGASLQKLEYMVFFEGDRDQAEVSCQNDDIVLASSQEMEGLLGSLLGTVTGVFFGNEDVVPQWHDVSQVVTIPRKWVVPRMRLFVLAEDSLLGGDWECGEEDASASAFVQLVGFYDEKIPPQILRQRKKRLAFGEK